MTESFFLLLLLGPMPRNVRQTIQREKICRIKIGKSWEFPLQTQFFIKINGKIEYLPPDYQTD